MESRLKTRTGMEGDQFQSIREHFFYFIRVAHEDATCMLHNDPPAGPHGNYTTLKTNHAFYEGVMA